MLKSSLRLLLYILKFVSLNFSLISIKEKYHKTQKVLSKLLILCKPSQSPNQHLGPVPLITGTHIPAGFLWILTRFVTPYTGTNNLVNQFRTLSCILTMYRLNNSFNSYPTFQTIFQYTGTLCFILCTFCHRTQFINTFNSIFMKIKQPSFICIPIKTKEKWSLKP